MNAYFAPYSGRIQRPFGQMFFKGRPVAVGITVKKDQRFRQRPVTEPFGQDIRDHGSRIAAASGKLRKPFGKSETVETGQQFVDFAAANAVVQKFE